MACPVLGCLQMEQVHDLESYIHVHSARLKEALNAVWIKPSRRNVHRLRTEVRRLRAIFYLSKSGSKPRGLNRNLRKLGKVLGEIREIDVAIEDCENYSGLKCSKLRDQNAKRRRVLKDYLRRRRHGILKRLKRLQRALPPRLSKARVRKLMAELVKKKECRSKKEIHPLRIAIKKSRYLLEAFGRDAKDAKDLQAVLGRIHDLEVLEGLAGKTPELARDLEELRERSDRLAISAVGRTVRRLETVLHR